MRNNRKAQLKMAENVAILIVFFIIFIMGVVFYWNFFRAGLIKTSAEKFDIRTVEIAQRAYSLPELQCSVSNIVTEGCIDIYKARRFTELARSAYRVDYYEILGYSTIEVWVVYPPVGLENHYVLYNNTIENSTQASHLFMPILIFDPVKGETKGYSFGYMDVTVYTR